MRVRMSLRGARHFSNKCDTLALDRVLHADNAEWCSGGKGGSRLVRGGGQRSLGGTPVLQVLPKSVLGILSHAKFFSNLFREPWTMAVVKKGTEIRILRAKYWLNLHKSAQYESTIDQVYQMNETMAGIRLEILCSQACPIQVMDYRVINMRTPEL